MKPNAELAYRTLDFIAAHPERWNQATWLLKEECGTKACFAGNAVLLSPEAVVEYALQYAARTAGSTPIDDDVLYGKIGTMGCAVHVSEIEDPS